MARYALRLLSGLALLCAAATAGAATYNLASGVYPPCSSNNWSVSGSTYTCNWGSVTLSAGDTLLAGAGASLVAQAGLAINGATVGSSSQALRLATSYGTVVVRTGSRIFGAIEAGGRVELTGTQVTGRLSSTSSVTLEDSSLGSDLVASGNTSLSGSRVSGEVTVSNSGLSASGGQIDGPVRASGTIELAGVAVSGSVTSTNGALKVTGGTLNGTLTANGALTLSGVALTGNADSTNGKLEVSGGTVRGALSANGKISLDGNLSLTGSVTSRNGEIVTDEVSITGNLVGNCCQVRLKNTTLAGNASTVNGNLELEDSTVTGNLATQQRVRLKDSLVQGNVNAASWNNTTIKGIGSAKIYGTCTPSATTPADLCEAAPPPVSEVCFRDDFGRSDLGGDWAATSRSGTFGMPRVVGNRLRLTDASGNVSTAATVLRLLPALNNKIRVQFKLYAYGGNGADGVALVLSDGTVTPQPGSSGGPLGYGYKPGVAGFAGGWLGIGLDEFGNFSAEGGSGSTSRTPDSVAVRGSGSGTAGYRRLAGTASLSPGVDAPKASDGPGALYRITLDSTATGKAVLTIERDTGDGFATLIPALDLLAASDQARLPDDFYLSLTGSTGGSTNIHEIDDFEICASRISSVEQPIDHFEFVTASGATTCAPQAVTVSACTNPSGSGSCQPYAGNVDITLASDGWVGGARKTLVNGSGTFYLQGLQTRMPLGYLSATPAARPLSQTLCKIGNGAWGTACQLTFAQGGFLFDVPTLTANREQSAIAIRAVINKGSASSPRCEPAFVDSERAVGFWSDYIDPAGTALTSRPAVSVNGQAVSQNALAPTALPLRFDAQGKASLRVAYAEAGQLQLNARYDGSAAEGDSGSMLGADQFVAVPAGFCIQPEANCSAGDASCSRFRQAGEPFAVRLRPVAWQADGDSDLCSGNATTLNYRQNGLVLSPQLLAPADGEAGRVLLPATATYDHQPPASASGWNGEVSQAVAFSEVGVFRLQVTPPAGGYFGASVPASASAPIGRIVPALLDVTGSASLTPSCGGLFSYQDQPIGLFGDDAPTLSITAYGRTSDGARFVTRNYDRPGFWKLDSRFPRRLASLDASGVEDASNRVRELQAGDFAPLEQTGLDVVGDGSRRYRLDGASLAFARNATPGPADLPFEGRVRLALEAAAFTDADGVCREEGGRCQGYDLDFGGSQIRLGRLQVGNAHGPETQPLDLPWTVESWQGSALAAAFLEETADRCTAALLSAPVLAQPSGNLRLGDLGVENLPRSASGGVLRLSAPGAGHDGSIQAGFPLTATPWLTYAWQASGNRSAAIGQATFGIFHVPRPLIFRRETYR